MQKIANILSSFVARKDTIYQNISAAGQANLENKNRKQSFIYKKEK